MACRVFVTVDMEGIAGIVHREETSPHEREYGWARHLMTQEANAVVAGVLAADPEAQVTVADVHGPYRNLLPEELDPRATLLRGKPRALGMMDGIDRGYDLALFVGAHAQAGAWPAVLSHTFTGNILAVRLNGRFLGEVGLNAALAGAFGVPVGMVAGDEAAAAEARELLGPAVVTLALKRPIGYIAAESVSPQRARALLHEAAAEAVRRWHAGQFHPVRLDEPVEGEVTFANPALADLAALADDIERLDGRTVRFRRSTVPSAYRLLRLFTVLCSTPL